MLDELHPREASLSARLRGGALFAALFIALLALQTAPGRLLPVLPGSADPGFALALAWMMRRPDQLPPPLLAALFLLADLVHGVPPGPGAALSLAACEFIRPRAAALASLPFSARWLMAAALSIARYPAEALVLSLLLVPHPPIETYLVTSMFTALVWPVMAVIAALLAHAGVRRES